MAELIPENVQDYPRPPVVQAVPQRLRVVLGGAVIADTTRGLRVLETHHAPTYYLPPADIADDVLTAVAGSSFCEWKGRARYFDVQGGGCVAPRAAWCYPAPAPAFRALADYVAFYPGRMQSCWVGETRVAAQPGSFYGGWITPNLAGIVKGGPDTEGW